MWTTGFTCSLSKHQMLNDNIIARRFLDMEEILYLTTITNILMHSFNWLGVPINHKLFFYDFQSLLSPLMESLMHRFIQFSGPLGPLGLDLFF